MQQYRRFIPLGQKRNSGTTLEFEWPLRSRWKDLAFRELAIAAVLRRILMFLFAGVLFDVPLAAAPRLDDIFRQDILVLQGNFKADGKPALKARLFGIADDDSPFNISFKCTSSQVTLDGKRLDGKPAPYTITPEGVPPFAWKWAGLFQCLDKTADVEFWIEDDAPNTAHLGDVWVIAGGENVAVVSTNQSASSNNAIVSASPNGSKVVTCLPGAIGNAPVGEAPTLGWSFASGMAKALQRPQETYTISVSHARYSTWLPSSPNWLSLFGWDHKHDVTIGTRGIVWWWGEWEAEYSFPPAPMPNQRAATASGWSDLLADWEGSQERAFQKCLTGFTMMTAGDARPDDNEPAQVKQLTLVVQLQGVKRQPEHVKSFDFEKNATSSWELFRAAQNQAVSILREKRTVGGTLGIGGETIRPRAAIIPAVRSQANQFPDKWFWRPEDIARLSDELVTVALGHLGPASGQSVELGLPVAKWTEKGVTLHFFAKPAKMPEGTKQPAELQYCTEEEPDSWITFTNQWSDTITIAPAGKRVRAVRYGAGNAPILQYWIAPGTNQLPITIPTFEFYRPPAHA